MNRDRGSVADTAGAFKELLDEDLECSEKAKHFYCLSERSLEKNSLLQIKSIANISVPKKEQCESAYDPYKNVLKLVLTDGQGSCTAIVYEPINKLNPQTPPGTKLRILKPITGTTDVKLTRDNCEIIGGYVKSLVDKWKLLRIREMNEQWGIIKSNDNSEGPPPWKRFGQKINVDLSEIRNAKAMDIINKQKDQNELDETEFEAQRKEAINELSKLQLSSSSKQFGSAKPLLQKEIAIIVSKGFSMSEAEAALHKYKSSQKALKMLMDSKHDGPRPPPKPKTETKKPTRKNLLKDEDEDDDEEYRKQPKPSSGISLFGFIQDKIPETKSSSNNDNPVAETETHANQSHNDHYDNSRGRGGRGRGRGRGGRGRGNYHHETSERTYQHSNSNTTNSSSDRTNTKPVSYNNYNNSSSGYDHDRGNNSFPPVQKSGYQDDRKNWQQQQQPQHQQPNNYAQNSQNSQYYNNPNPVEYQQRDNNWRGHSFPNSERGRGRGSGSAGSGNYPQYQNSSNNMPYYANNEPSSNHWDGNTQVFSRDRGGGGGGRGNGGNQFRGGNFRGNKSYY